jgi:hypothetical protein
MTIASKATNLARLRTKPLMFVIIVVPPKVNNLNEFAGGSQQKFGPAMVSIKRRFWSVK